MDNLVAMTLQVFRLNACLFFSTVPLVHITQYNMPIQTHVHTSRSRHWRLKLTLQLIKMCFNCLTLPLERDRTLILCRFHSHWQRWRRCVLLFQLQRFVCLLFFFFWAIVYRCHEYYSFENFAITLDIQYILHWKYMKNERIRLNG